MTWDFADWRREIEAAIRRGEAIPIRVPLDQAEREFENLESLADDLELEHLDAGAPESATPANTEATDATPAPDA